MLKRDLDHLLRSESETVEWKRSLGEWKEIVITSAAMASLHGGHIIIGVDRLEIWNPGESCPKA
ncbi:MAG: hypothetical protein ABIE47_00180 [Pseudomonadota bacterium]